MYPSTVEFYFYGEPSQNDAMSLKSIAVVDPTQQTQIGELHVLEATGGMIKLQVDTADVLSDPMFFRVRMKQINSSQPSFLSYAGMGFGQKIATVVARLCAYTNRLSC
jgi:hypothetical protein